MKRVLGRIVFWLGYPVLFFVLRNSRRTKVVVIAGNEILLVKNMVDNKNRWTLPGGGVKGSETDKACAVRELKEEIGCVIDTKDLRLLGEGTRKSAGFSYTAVYFAVPCEKRRKIKKGLEITEVDWFSIKNLPQNRKPLVNEALSLLKQG